MHVVPQITNAIYLGHSNDDGIDYYYVGQAKDPCRRWEQHLQRSTGPCPFGDETRWAVLAWDIPTDKLNSAESYLIGYVLCRFGCVNGNRGNDEKAFVQGFRDARLGKPPAVCAHIILETLDWQEIESRSEGIIVDNRIQPSVNTDLWERVWGLHALDKDKVVELYLSQQRMLLNEQFAAAWKLKRETKDLITLTRVTWLALGAIVGITLFCMCR